jgi:hypothetical protein
MCIVFLIIAKDCDTCIQVFKSPVDRIFWGAKRKILCGKYISYIFHVFSEARDHILILNILFFNKLRQIHCNSWSKKWNAGFTYFYLHSENYRYIHSGSLSRVIKFYWLMLLLYPGELYRLLGASSFLFLLCFCLFDLCTLFVYIRVKPPDTFLEENHPMTISSKFCSYWANGFRQKDFYGNFP